MKKTVNFTIRIEPKLLAEARIAAEYLDTDISKTLRASLREIVRRYHHERAIDTGRHRVAMEGDLAEHAMQALKEKVEKMGGEARLDSSGRLVSSENPVKVTRDPVEMLQRGDTSHLTRKQRRQFERDKAKGRV